MLLYKLVIYLQDDALVGAILLCELSPDGGELIVSGTSLVDNPSVPSRVIVLDNASARRTLFI